MRTLLLATALFAPSLLVAQSIPADVARERTERAHWIGRDPLSPARALALASIPPAGLTLGGTGSDVPIAGAPSATVHETAGQATLSGWGADRPLPVGRAFALYGVHLVPVGLPGRMQLAVYGDAKPGKRPKYYHYVAGARLTVTLTPTTPKPQRILSPEGATVQANEIGTVNAMIGGMTVLLRVMRVSTSEEESELLINFRDATNGAGSYPAGRFVELIPLGGDRYTLDLNRAFNPYCSYSSVFPCPIPWAGNAFTGKIEAGEMYPPEAVR